LIDNTSTGAPSLVGGGWLGTVRPVCVIDHSDPPAGYVTVGAGYLKIASGA
jgi:hypothetical protein